MAAASSGRAEIDTSRPFRSVKEAVAVFGERILLNESHFKRNIKYGGSNSIRAASLITRQSHSKPNAIANAKHGGSSRITSAPNPMPVAVSRPMPPTVPVYSVPSSPPFFASSPSLDNGDEEQGSKEAELMIISSIKKLETETAKTRQEAAQLKQRVSEMELAMAALNAKLQRGLSKLAHMEADKAAVERANIRGHNNISSQPSIRGDNSMAVTVWGERRAARPPSRSLRHLISLDEMDEDLIGQRRRKLQKRKPIVPLIVPLIADMWSSRKKERFKDRRDRLYMDELYNLLRLS